MNNSWRAWNIWNERFRGSNQSYGDQTGAFGTAFSLATSLCRTLHRHHSPRVPGPRIRVRRAELIPSPARFRGLLSSEPDAPGIGEELLQFLARSNRRTRDWLFPFQKSADSTIGRILAKACRPAERTGIEVTILFRMAEGIVVFVNRPL